MQDREFLKNIAKARAEKILHQIDAWYAVQKKNLSPDYRELKLRKELKKECDELQKIQEFIAFGDLNLIEGHIGLELLGAGLLQQYPLASSSARQPVRTRQAGSFHIS